MAQRLRAMYNWRADGPGDRPFARLFCFKYSGITGGRAMANRIKHIALQTENPAETAE